MRVLQGNEACIVFFEKKKKRLLIKIILKAKFT